MLEIRIHGRGGQGAVIASKVLAASFFREGCFVQAFPAFGVERRGAPVMAFVRIDNAPVRLRCNVYAPEHLIVLDQALTETVDITEGFKQTGWILLNSRRAPDQFEYSHKYKVNAHEAFADFHVSVNPPAGLRRWVRPQAAFSFDGRQPFKPLPRDQAFPMLEWGLNWCVSTQAHHYLIIHAAVVEKNGLAAILPAPPGSGKSTLTAGLVLSGWRLLSDELTLIDRKSGLIQPLPRPVSLKNQSIDVIRQFDPEAFINRASRDTIKGTVAHMRPPRDSVLRQHEMARPGWVIFPKWVAGAPATLTPRSQAQTFMFLAQNAFNYSQLGRDGFPVGTALIDQTACYDFHYSQLQ